MNKSEPLTFESQKKIRNAGEEEKPLTEWRNQNNDRIYDPAMCSVAFAPFGNVSIRHSRSLCRFPRNSPDHNRLSTSTKPFLYALQQQQSSRFLLSSTLQLTKDGEKEEPGKIQ
jgi:hypothetical protein